MYPAMGVALYRRVNGLIRADYMNVTQVLSDTQYFIQEYS